MKRAAWTIALFAACAENEPDPGCIPGPSECDGDRVRECIRDELSPNGTLLTIATCEPGMCREGLRDCIHHYGSGPDGTEPQCDGNDQSLLDGAGYCDGQTRVGCYQGYAVVHQPSACEQRCHVTATGIALCVDNAPDARCMEMGFYSTCDGAAIKINCVDGYALSSSDCSEQFKMCDPGSGLCILL